MRSRTTAHPTGRAWLGLNRKSFLGAACVRQAQILRLLNDADALQEDLQRAAGTAGTDETAARALELLTAYCRERVGSTQARTKPLPVARDRVSRSRAALEQARRAQGEYLDRRHEVVRLERQAKSCEQEAATLRAAQAVEAASGAARRAGRAVELSALFPDGPPRRSSEDDRLAQQVAAALATWSARPEPRSPGGPSVEALERELAATTEPAWADAVGPGPRSVPPYPAVAPYLAAAGVAAGIALLDRASDRPLGASEARLGVQMDPDGARRLNRSSPSCLNSGAQRTDFFHGLLGILGERESDAEHLEQAVAAYRAALQELTRERVPLDWARTQKNLGSALQILGAWESDAERLEQAIAACRAALQELPREHVPLDWARAQNNLGNALATLGAQESGTEHLKQAVAAYRAALQELPREHVPRDWDRTQKNLGRAIQILRERGRAF